ncbi:hypothetical protein [Primorskyibacter sedentarius]|uniref:hypothetical protein n=1 Tax=Primorskyibacter sedentarius TaxID=745311 RepID=UPI003EBEF4BE
MVTTGAFNDPAKQFDPKREESSGAGVTAGQRWRVLKVKRSEFRNAVAAGKLQEITQDAVQPDEIGLRSATATAGDGHPADEDEDAADMTRLIAKADAEMGNPAGSRRRHALAHLRAAAAATRAGLESPNKCNEPDAETRYRQDLATSADPDTSHAHPVYATLMLVPEQRTDITHQAMTSRKPSQVNADAFRHDPRVQSDPGADQIDFPEFVRVRGATALPDLMEAAVVYLSYVEDCKQFTLQQLMRKIRAVETSKSTRKARLQVLANLMKDGKVARLSKGVFAAPNCT